MVMQCSAEKIKRCAGHTPGNTTISADGLWVTDSWEHARGHTPGNKTTSPGALWVTEFWGTRPRLHTGQHDVTLYCCVLQNLNPLLMNLMLRLQHLLSTPPKADESSSSTKDNTSAERQPPHFSAESGARASSSGVDTDDPE